MTRPLEDVQDEILDALHAGEPMDREAVIASHPEHTQALEAFFEVVELMEAAPEPTEAVPAKLGEFRIIKEIGRGGMGVVYEAEQPSLKRRVALKVLPPNLRVDRGLLARFQREAEAAARLRHPNLVPVFSCGESAGTPFFAMELVEGASLAEVIRERRAGSAESWPETAVDSWRRAVTICTSIADALQYAHGSGILHRDVKPANILLEANGTPRLTDFGLALDLEASSLTVSGEVFGSPQYMSPEQAFRRKSPLDARTDVYSLGVTLYELLTLELPHGGRTQSDILAALSSGELVPLRAVNPELPVALERVLERALQHDPAERYADIAEFASDLRVVLDGGGVKFSRVGAKRRSRSRWTLGWTMSVVGSGLAVSAIIFGTFSWLDSRMPFLEPPGATEFLAVARGELDRGEALMQNWFEPGIGLRGVVARNSRAICSLGMQMVVPDLQEALVLVPLWESSIDGGPWAPTQSGFMPIDLIGSGEIAYKFNYDLHETIGERADSRTVSVAHRLRARLVERTDALNGETQIPIAEIVALTRGTMCTWSWPARTLFLYDEYPADYPELVEGEEFDETMRNATIPRNVKFHTIGAREVTLSLGYENDQAYRPLPTAFEVELRDVGTGAQIATATMARHADLSVPPGNMTRTTRVYVMFNMPEEPSEIEARFLLGTRSGDIDQVRLVFRPSREVALAEPDFDRYWAGEVDAVIPFEQ